MQLKKLLIIVCYGLLTMPQTVYSEPENQSIFTTSQSNFIQLSDYQKFKKLLSNNSVLPIQHIEQIPHNISRISLHFQPNTKQNNLPAFVIKMIEEQLIQRLKLTNRFELYECLECDSIQILVNPNSFAIEQHIQTSQRLFKITKDLNLDAIFLLSAYEKQNKAILNLKLISPTSEILWQHHYIMSPEFIYDYIQLEANTTFRGLSLERLSKTTTKPTIAINGLAAIGIQLTQPVKLYNNLLYTVGIEYFRNMTQTKFINLSGFTPNIKLRIGVDQWLLTSRKSSNAMGLENTEINDQFNLYLKVEGHIVKSLWTQSVQTGLDFYFTRYGSLNIGIGHMSEVRVPVKAQLGYESFIDFGGIFYQIGIGLRY